MTAVLAEVHYLPDTWVGKAHTQQVSNQFSQIFPFKAVSFLIYYKKYKFNYYNVQFLFLELLVK